MLQRLRSGQEGQCELPDEGVRDDARADQAEPEIVLKLELSFVFLRSKTVFFGFLNSSK
jgi:hypothetical protein